MSAPERDPVADLYAELLDARQNGEDPDLEPFLDRCPPERREELRRAIEFIDETGLWPGGPPRRLGDFELGPELGRGGMGIVYEAYQASLDRHVALKLIAPWLPRDDRAIERFRREAVAIAQLRHPSIVTVFETGEASGHRYLAMERVEGDGLDVILKLARERGERLPIRRVLGWGAEIASALETAHAAGIVHRDVKPSNILIERDGRARLLDFGLARFADAARSVTGFQGSPQYASPEQVAGGEVGPRSDLYSLGVTLYEAVTGAVAFSGDSTPRILHDVLHREPVPPRRLAPNIARDVETVLLCCLEKEPARRYADATELREDLEALLEVRPIQARPASRVDRAVKWIRRNRPIALALVVALLAAAVVVGTLLERAWSDYRAAEDLRVEGEAAAQRGELDVALRSFDRALVRRPEDAALVTRRAEVERAKRDEETAALRAETRRLEGMRLVFQARTVLESDPALALLLAIEGARRHPGPLAHDTLRAALASHRELRTRRLDAQLQRADRHARGTVTLDAQGRVGLWNDTAQSALRPFGTDEVVAWTLSPGGRRGVFLVGGRFIALCALDTGRIESSWTIAGGEHLAATSSHVAVASGETVVLFGMNGEEVATATVASEILCLAFSRDGSVLALGTQEGAIELRSVEDPLRETTWAAHDDGVIELIPIGEGGRLSRSWDRTVRWTEDGEERERVEDHADDVRCVVAASDGTWFATGCDDGRVRVVRDGRLEILADLGTWITALAVDTEGHLLAAGGADGLVRVWDLQTGGPALVLRALGEEILSLEFRGARQLDSISADGTLQRWNVGGSTEPLVLAGHEAEVWSAEFRFDGETVLTASDDQTARVWSLETGATVGIVGPGAVVREAAGSSEPREVFLRTPWGVRRWSVGDREPRWQAERLADGMALSSEWVAAIDDDRLALLDRETGVVLEDWTVEDGLSGQVIVGAHGRFVAASPIWWRPEIPVVFPGSRSSEVRRLIGHAGRVAALAAHPRESRLASASWDGSVRIWDVDRARELRVLPVGERLVSVDWSSDGRWLAVGAADGRAGVWDAESGERLWVQSLLDTAVRQVTFSPDCRWVAAVGGDSVDLRDARTGERHSSLRGHRGRITDLAFRFDGRRVVTASEDGTARVWFVEPLDLAIRLRPRELTEEERERYEITPID